MKVKKISKEHISFINMSILTIIIVVIWGSISLYDKYYYLSHRKFEHNNTIVNYVMKQKLAKEPINLKEEFGSNLKNIKLIALDLSNIDLSNANLT